MRVYRGVVYKNRTKKLDVKISTDNEGRANCRAAMSTSKKCKNLFSRNKSRLLLVESNNY